MRTHSVKRQQFTLVLGVIFLLLMGVIAWMEMAQQPAATISTHTINSITIKRRGHDDIELTRQNDNWLMTTPYSLAANKQRIEPLLTLGTATFDGYDKSEVDMPATGLENPGASLLVGKREILLGKVDIDGERRYALVNGKVSLLPEWVWSLVHGGVSAFAELAVFGDLPDSLYLTKLPSSDNNDTILIEQIEPWQDLQADKISAWPQQAGHEHAAQEVLARWLLSKTDTAKTDNTLAEILRFAEHTLIQTEPGYAYAISNTRLDALLPQ